MGEHKEAKRWNLGGRLIKHFPKRFRSKSPKSPLNRPPAREEASSDAVTTSSIPPAQKALVLVPSPVQSEQNPSQKGLWVTAADSLDPGDRGKLDDLLRSKRECPNGRGPDSLADEVSSTLSSAEKLKEEGREATWRPVVDKIVKGALAFKSLGDAAAAFDKSGYAALGWSVVSFGLQLAANAEEAHEFVLSSLEIITRCMEKYRRYEQVCRGPDAGEEFDHLLSNVYKAILLHVIALDEYLRRKPIERFAHAIRNLEDQSIHLTKKAVEVADAEVSNWLMYILILRTDNSFSHLRTILKDRELPQIPQPSQECLKSLSFEKMNDRLNDIEHAADGTCKWLLSHKEYRDWADGDRGLLCIKGKPGSGKSTLLRYALRDAIVASNLRDRSIPRNSEGFYQKDTTAGAQAEAVPLTLSFFFHDRGEELQRTALGLFRSLLHQLLRCLPHAIPEALLKTFQGRKLDMGEPGKEWHWHWRELRDFFQLSLRKVLESHPVWLFIDALDEYGEKNANDLITSVNSWFQQCQSHAQFHVFLTCRHHPPLALPDDRLEICLENENKHDISTWVHTQLSPWLTDEKLGAICTIITDRASGVFMWARLIAERVLDLQRQGANWIKIKGEVDKSPRELYDLYRGVVKAMADKPTALRLITWICFAMRPLTLDELRWAMIVDPDYSDKPASLRHYENTEEFAANCEMMEKKLKALSCGLAEAVPSSHDVQFIHQSVKDFFVKEGLSTLKESQRPTMTKTDTNQIDTEATAHYQLSRTCIRYFSAKEVRGLEYPSRKVKALFPFLGYATAHWIAHVQQSEKKVPNPQTDLLVYLEWPSEAIVQLWTRLCKVLSMHTRSGLYPPQGTTMLHIVSKHRLMGPMLQILQRKEELTSRLDPLDDESRTPLWYAAGTGHTDVVSLLVDNGANANGLGASNASPLVAASYHGYYRIVQILLDKGADVNKKGADYDTALQAASSGGYEKIVRLLLDKGADANAEAGTSGTALQQASYMVHGEIVRLLLENGANVNAEAGDHGTALQAASHNGDEETVRLLLKNGADINADGRIFGTALRAASSYGHEQIVRMLLEKGADVNARRGKLNMSALELASSNGYEQVVQILIEYGAERQSPVL